MDGGALSGDCRRIQQLGHPLGCRMCGAQQQWKFPSTVDEPTQTVGDLGRPGQNTTAGNKFRGLI